MFGAKKNLFTSNYRCIRVVEMIVLSAESKYKMKKQAKHGIVVK